MYCCDTIGFAKNEPVLWTTPGSGSLAERIAMTAARTIAGVGARATRREYGYRDLELADVLRAPLLDEQVLGSPALHRHSCRRLRRHCTYRNRRLPGRHAGGLDPGVARGEVARFQAIAHQGGWVPTRSAKAQQANFG